MNNDRLRFRRAIYKEDFLKPVGFEYWELTDDKLSPWKKDETQPYAKDYSENHFLYSFDSWEQSTGLRDATRTEEYPEGKLIYAGDKVKRPDGSIGMVICPLIDKYGNEWACFGLDFSNLEPVIMNLKEASVLKITGTIYEENKDEIS